MSKFVIHYLFNFAFSSENINGSINSKRSKEGFLGSKIDHNKRKSDFLKEIVKTVTSRKIIIYEDQKRIDFHKNKTDIKTS